MDRKIIIASFSASFIFPSPSFAASAGLGCDISAIPMALLLVGVCCALQLRERMK